MSKLLFADLRLEDLMSGNTREDLPALVVRFGLIADPAGMEKTASCTCIDKLFFLESYSSG